MAKKPLFLEFIQKKISREKLFLFAIFLFALFLRTINLSTLPYAFHTDELISGYVGRFVLLSGRDIYGNIFPFFYFDKFGDYRVILPMYLSGISTFIFGVNEFAVRFPAAFFGALMVFPVYRLAMLLAPGYKFAAFISSFSIAFMPWHIVLSRATSEGIIGLLIFSFAVVFLLQGIFESKKKSIFASVFLFLITYFMYPSFRALTPLAFLPVFLLFDSKKYKYLLLALTFFFFIFTFLVGTTDWGKARFEQTSLFGSEKIANQVKADNDSFSFDEGNNSARTARFFHNKATGYVKVFFEHYLEYFSPQFLFLKGGLPYRYLVPDFGLIYITFLILLAGLLLPVQLKLNNRIFLYVLYLLLISPLPGALTVDDIPNTHRVLLMMLPLSVLTGLGFWKIKLITEKRKYFQTLFLVFIFVLFSLEFVYFFHQYFSHTASLKSFQRNDGFKELVYYVKENKEKYSYLYMPMFETLPIYYLFYSNDFSKDLAGKFYKRTETSIDRIDNISFVYDWCPTKVMRKEEFKKNSLIIEEGSCENREGFEEVKVIYRHDSTRVFRIIK